jgi:hypothetical protein
VGTCDDDDGSVYSPEQRASRARYDAQHEQWRSLVDAINSSTDVFSLIRSVEAARAFIEAIEEPNFGHFRPGGNGEVDVRLLGGCLRKVVAELIDASGPVLARDLAALLGVAEDHVKLALYYLHKFGVANRERQGRSFSYALLTTDIAGKAVAREWSSLQGRPIANRSPPVADT